MKHQQALNFSGNEKFSVLFNIFTNYMGEGIECTSVTSQMMPSEVAVLTWLRVGKIYRGIWTGQINGPRPMV